MDSETLESIFVQRHALLKQSVQWVEESLFTHQKKHLLFIGPRGSGKTHLITMIINRLKTTRDPKELVIVWLGEDDVIMNFTGFALAVINQMALNYPARFNNNCLDALAVNKSDDIGNIIFNDIQKQVGDAKLLIVKENMSDVFAGLKDIGQKQLRAYLQEHDYISLLCSSQKLFNGVSSRSSAFWGFFDIHHLTPLSVEEAMMLMKNIAQLKQDNELVEFLDSDQGYYRVRALHYLAGGNHRLYIELASFLTKASLDSLVDAITQLADHLTPYFQERIRSLSPQQAGIIQKLCKLSSAVQVKVLAKSLFIDERSVASQLKELKDMGYVISHKRGRSSYYEIAEPLLRLSLEVKNNHGKPLRIIASLFRAWFSDNELQEIARQGDELLRSYCKTALEHEDILNYLQTNIRDDLVNSFDQHDYRETVQKANQLLSIPNNSEENKLIALAKRSMAYWFLNEYMLAVSDIDEIIKLTGNRDEVEHQIVLALSFIRCMIYTKLGDSEKEFQYLNEFINLPQNSGPFLDLAIFMRSWHLFRRGYIELSLKDLNALINSASLETKLLNKSLFNRSQVYEFLGDYDNALNDLNKIDYAVLSSEDAGLTLMATAEVQYLSLNITEARNALEKAFEVYGVESIVSNDGSFLQAIAKLGFDSWPDEINFLLSLYNKYDALVILASSLIKSIEIFTQNKLMNIALQKWASLWAVASKNYPEMELAVAALVATAAALEVGNDSPLFMLPKEIRGLVLPMLAGVLPESVS